MQFDPTKIGFAEELDSYDPAPPAKSNKKATAPSKKATALGKDAAEKEIPTDVTFTFEITAEEKAPVVEESPSVEVTAEEEPPVIDVAAEPEMVDEPEPEVVDEPEMVDEPEPEIEDKPEPVKEPEPEPEIVAEPVKEAETVTEPTPEMVNIFSNASPEFASEGAVDLSALAANGDTEGLLSDETASTEKDNAPDTAIAPDAAVTAATADADAISAEKEAAATENTAVAETPAAEKTAATEKAAVAETSAAEKKADEKTVATDTAAEATAKKDGFFVRALKFFIPWKGDPAKELFRKLVFLVALVVFIGALSYLTVYLNDRLKYEASISYAEELVNKEDTTVGTDQIMNKYRDLYNDNNDFCGWITIPNTNVDGAVYQTLNNSYYINHNGQKKKSIYGAYFADYKCTLAASGSSQNITLYGHHMNDQTMFAQIRKYKDLSFYKENPTLTFDTLYTSSKYKVFAAFITNADPADDNGYFFDFAVQGFINQEDFLAWIEQVRRRSLINTAVDIVEGDEILTLSTCTYELGTSKDMRFVVMARKVRDGETETVNVASATQNATPLYPAAWYKRFGSKKPVFEDGLYTWGETSSVQQEIIEQVIIPPSSSDVSSEASSVAPSTPSFQNPFYSSSAPATSSGWYTPEIVNPWDEEAESFVNPWDDTSATTSFTQSTDNNPQYNF